MDFYILHPNSICFPSLNSQIRVPVRPPSSETTVHRLPSKIMLEKNSILIGLFIGLAVPLVGFATFKMLTEQLYNLEFLDAETRTIHIRERTLAILAICLNLIPFNLFQKRRAEASMRGMMLSTLVYVLLWLYFFSNTIFQN